MVDDRWPMMGHSLTIASPAFIESVAPAESSGYGVYTRQSFPLRDSDEFVGGDHDELLLKIRR